MSRVLVAPDKLKGSLCAADAGRLIREGLAAGCPDVRCDVMPLADGGEGTLDVLVGADGGSTEVVQARDPLGRWVRARLGLSRDGQAAIIESAEACGLWRVPPEQRAPLLATSIGVGDLVQEALGRGRSRLYLGLGGSATVDAGLGLLAGLGARFLDPRGEPLALERWGTTAAGTARVESSLAEFAQALAAIDVQPARDRLAGAELVGLCDVAAPLLGALRYAPQKGADHASLAALATALRAIAAAAPPALGHLAELPGAGAAGGLGWAIALLGGRLVSGADHVLDAVHASARMQGVSLVVGAEGRVDEQTLEGKAMLALGRRARAAGVRCVILCGSLEATPAVLAALHREGFDAVLPLLRDGLDVAQAMAQAGPLLRARAEELGRFLFSAQVSGGASA